MLYCLIELLTMFRVVLQTITSLKLPCNYIGDTGVQYLADELQNNTVKYF